jgi:predicted DNA-binding protein with PD1-like motif
VAFARAHQLKAALVLTCVGSLRRAALRLANQPHTTYYDDKFEIVALVGTLSPDGPHLHLALSDGRGVTIGGHLQDGSHIYTTAEIVLAELTDLVFSRPVDPETTYDELTIQPRGA